MLLTRKLLDQGFILSWSHHFESCTVAMTWLPVMEYLCQKWPRICSTYCIYRKHLLAVRLFTTEHHRTPKNYHRTHKSYHRTHFLYHHTEFLISCWATKFYHKTSENGRRTLLFYHNVHIFTELILTAEHFLLQPINLQKNNHLRKAYY